MATSDGLPLLFLLELLVGAGGGGGRGGGKGEGGGGDGRTHVFNVSLTHSCTCVWATRAPRTNRDPTLVLHLAFLRPLYHLFLLPALHPTLALHLDGRTGEALEGLQYGPIPRTTTQVAIKMPFHLALFQPQPSLPSFLPFLLLLLLQQQAIHIHTPTRCTEPTLGPSGRHQSRLDRVHPAFLPTFSRFLASHPFHGPHGLPVHGA